MLPTIIDELKKRQSYGNQMAAQLVERIDAHIRDLETSKVWILSNAKAESDAIDVLLGAAPAATTRPEASLIPSKQTRKAT